jgi:hypothetical protein
MGVKLERERERERGFELRKGWFKVYSSELSGQPSWGVEGGFYNPQKESAHWGVNDLDMSGVRGQTCLKSISRTQPRHRTCPVSGIIPG